MMQKSHSKAVIQNPKFPVLLGLLLVLQLGLPVMTSTALRAQTAPASPVDSGEAIGNPLSGGTQPVIDPAQLQSKPKSDLETFTLESLYATRSIGAAAWSPDGKQVVFVSDISGHFNLWLLPSEGGWPVQLTISDQQDAPAWSPDGRWIAYTNDNNKARDIYLVSPRTGEVVNLTASTGSANTGATWSPDGKQIAFMTRARNSPNYQIDVIEVLTRRTTHLTPNASRESSNTRPIWSRDGKWMAWTESNAGGRDSNVVVAEVATGKTKRLTEHGGEIGYEASSWSADGKKLLVTSNALNGYANVALLDVSTKQLEWLTRDERETTSGTFSPDGGSVTWTDHVAGNSTIVLHELASGKTTALPLPAGENSLAGAENAFSPDGGHLLCRHAGPEPGDLINFDLAAKTPRQITNSLVAGLNGGDMVHPTVVRYPSSDGKWQISALAYIPHNIARNAAYPAIVWVHGGPGPQQGDGFDRFIQYIVNQGYVVIAPNYRGSNGHGKQFQNANYMDAGGGDLQDVLDAAGFISRSGFVDPKKLIVAGENYGGYLAIMAATKAPAQWAAAVAVSPFVSWSTEFRNNGFPNADFLSGPSQRSNSFLMGDPVKNKALWEERSPINFLERIQAPLLLLSGNNDPQFPPSEAQQADESIRKRGGPVQLKIYANEGREISQPEDKLDADKRAADFIKSHVPSPGCGCSLLE